MQNQYDRLRCNSEARGGKARIDDTSVTGNSGEKRQSNYYQDYNNGGDISAINVINDEGLLAPIYQHQILGHIHLNLPVFHSSILKVCALSNNIFEYVADHF